MIVRAIKASQVLTLTFVEPLTAKCIKTCRVDPLVSGIMGRSGTCDVTSLLTADAGSGCVAKVHIGT